jgi:hypothetical protein
MVDVQDEIMMDICGSNSSSQAVLSSWKSSFVSPLQPLDRLAKEPHSLSSARRRIGTSRRPFPTSQKISREVELLLRPELHHFDHPATSIIHSIEEHRSPHCRLTLHTRERRRRESQSIRRLRRGEHWTRQSGEPP